VLLPGFRVEESAMKLEGTGSPKMSVNISTREHGLIAEKTTIF
jgi:hypothetical protein